MLWLRVVLVLCVLFGFAAWLWSIKDNAPAPDNQLTEPKITQNEEGLPELATWDIQYVDQAKDDIEGLIKYFVRAPKRRAAPRWSVPLEVWFLLLLPNWRIDKSRWGTTLSTLRC